MTFIQSNYNKENQFSSKKEITSFRVFRELDSRDGKVDGRISANVWNTFTSRVGGNTVSSHISGKDAMKSIDSYLKKGKKTAIFNYFKKPNNLESKKQLNTVNPDLALDHSQSNTTYKNLKQQLTMGADINFSEETVKMNSKKYAHNTRVLDVAESHLGLVEITEKEYNFYKQNDPSKLEGTQYSMIGKHGQITDQWCAHTVSTLSERAGVDIGGHKKAVSEFVAWAKSKNDFRQIKTNWMNKNNVEQERISRAEQIEAQMYDMSEGDFIVWKASYAVDVGNKNLKNKQSSHIGIIEDVDLNSGKITVIEGNANLFRKDENGRLFVVNRYSDGINGNQERGDFQEVNYRDGLIRKEYTKEDLAEMGYLGYIDNQRRLKSNNLAING